MQRNLPGLLFLVEKVVMEGTSQGVFLLAIVYTADPSVVKKLPQYLGHKREKNQLLLLPIGEIPKCNLLV